jgi:hypothetical protein
MVNMTTLDNIASAIAIGDAPRWLPVFLSNRASSVSAAIAIQKMRHRRAEMRADLNRIATLAESFRELLRNDFIREFLVAEDDIRIENPKALDYAHRTAQSHRCSRR